MKKTPLRKKAKKKSNPWWRKKAVEVAKLISKHEAHYTCATCGRTAEQGWQMHGSHIFPESKFLRLSCEPSNIMCQCAKCHMNWHEHPKGQDWFDKVFPNKIKELNELQSEHMEEIVKPDYEKITKNLREIYNNLIIYL